MSAHLPAATGNKSPAPGISPRTGDLLVPIRGRAHIVLGGYPRLRRGSVSVMSMLSARVRPGAGGCAVVVEPGAVVGGLAVAEDAGDGLAVVLAGPFAVGAVEAGGRRGSGSCPVRTGSCGWRGCRAGRGRGRRARRRWPRRGHAGLAWAAPDHCRSRAAVTPPVSEVQRRYDWSGGVCLSRAVEAVVGVAGGGGVRAGRGAGGAGGTGAGQVPAVGGGQARRLRL